LRERGSIAAVGDRTRRIGSGLAVLLLVLSCLCTVAALVGLTAGGPQAAETAEAGPAEALRAAYRRPATVPFPADNPYDRAKAELGRDLFFDPRLSGNNGLSCASCHVPELGFEDGQPIGFGASGQPVGRHVPTLWNLAWGKRFFWDGRAASLEEQALGPIQNPIEMDQDLDALVRELMADPGYRARFAQAFPESPAIAPDTIAAALATYERTLVSPPAPFDRWIAGEEDAIDDAAKRGFALFNGKANCAACHSGWAFTDHAFHDIGLPDEDRGRGAILGLALLDHAFKTPTLREIGRRAPYMHDGSLPDLAAVIEHYETGIVERPSLSPDLKPIDLTPSERADLLAFLATLDSPNPTPPTIAPAVAAAPPDAPSAPKDLAEVTQRDKSFDRDSVALTEGGLLVVHNDDVRRHNLRIFHPKLDFNSGIQRPGESVAIRFPDAGTYRVFCGIHPTMELAVTVE